MSGVLWVYGDHRVCYFACVDNAFGAFVYPISLRVNMNHLLAETAGGQKPNRRREWRAGQLWVGGGGVQMYDDISYSGQAFC